MKYYKYFYWAYLILGALFAYNGYEEFMKGEQGKGFLGLALAALAVFMFFFRRRFVKKMEDRMQK